MQPKLASLLSQPPRELGLHTCATRPGRRAISKSGTRIPWQNEKEERQDTAKCPKIFSSEVIVAFGFPPPNNCHESLLEKSLSLMFCCVKHFLVLY